MNAATAAEVRAAIALHVLGDAPESPGLGELTLYGHQVEGAQRVRKLLDDFGGALLADDVGLGKTFIALAVARGMDSALVLAPAALRPAWLAAAERARISIEFTSIERLGRGGRTCRDAKLVIVDEAHHLRSTQTRRFAAACNICRGCKVLLMSATPVQNSVRDLRAVLSLFLGERANALPADDLARYVVRRVEGDLVPDARRALPVVREPQWIEAVADEDCLDHLMALPPPLPPMDGDDAGVLLTYTLARQWASSRGALRAALHRRLARAHAMEDLLRAGRMPTRAELSAWCFADGAQQLTFPELAVRHDGTDCDALLARIAPHVEGVRRLLAWLGRTPDPDVARASRLRQLLRRHAGERIVAFSEYADTVAALYRLLSPHERVAMLTHTGGRVAGGPLTRREVLARFAPGASHRTPESDRIDLLVTTDVLSEGVSLQDASVVVHLDLAWNPARLEQRAGRLRRIGAARDAISVYLFPPPAPAERLLSMERRLRVKLGAAARAVGVAGSILPGLAVPDAAQGPAPREERITAMLRGWRSGASIPAGAVVAAARSTRDGAIACIRRAGVVSLISVDPIRITDLRADVEQALLDGAGESLIVPEKSRRSIEERLARWLRRRTVSDVVDLTALRVARSRRALLNRVDTIARRAPRHVQSRLAPLMHAARSAATASLSAGAERVLDELALAPLGDEAWLHAIGEFASLHARGSGDATTEIVALLILVPE